MTTDNKDDKWGPMCYVDIDTGTIDGMFDAAELREIADLMDAAEAEKKHSLATVERFVPPPPKPPAPLPPISARTLRSVDKFHEIVRDAVSKGEDVKVEGEIAPGWHMFGEITTTRGPKPED